MSIYSDCGGGKNSFALWNDNSIKPCCVWRGETVNTSLQNSLDFYNQQSLNIEQGCAKCVWQQDRGLRSRKKTINDVLEKSSFFYDLSLSTVCNLACRMCGSHNSSKWLSIERDVFGGDLIHKQNASTDYDRVEEMLSHMNQQSKNNPIYIEIKGGEPLIQNDVFRLLENLKHPKNVNLSVVSNLTVLETDTLALLETFRETKIAASFEGTGETYNYIRADGDFADFEINLNKLKKSKIRWTFAPLILIYNIGDLHEYARFMHQHLGCVDEQLLYRPEHLNISCLPYYALDTMEIPNYMVSTLNAFGSEYNVNLINKFVEYTEKLDTYYRTDFYSTPTGKKLKPILEELN